MRSYASRAAFVRHRWRAHGFAGPLGATPEEIVRRLGAVQAEDYPLAKWALAQRGAGLTNAAIERAVADGTILRTHLLRPTWQFVLPRDLRWMQRLTAPRVRAAGASRLRQLELDPRLLSRCRTIIARALEGGRHLTRRELAEHLSRRRISAPGERLAHIVLDAELEGLVCSGVPRGISQTYALVDERAPVADRLSTDEALAELARRYFSTRGPATEWDFRWWSSLAARDARRAIQALGTAIEPVDLEGRTFWRMAGNPLPPYRRAPSVRLLHVLDEYIVSYTRSRDLMLQHEAERFSVFGGGGRQHPILRRGGLIGYWERRAAASGLALTVRARPGLRREDLETIRRAAVRHGRFFGRVVEVAL